MILPPNLFKPGAGAHPPHLAGRDGEIQAMAPMEAAIEAKTSPAADIILHGPRGNGKTVLLAVIGDRLERVGAWVVRVTAHEEIASWRALANALVPDDGWRGALRHLSERAGPYPAACPCSGAAWTWIRIRPNARGAKHIDIAVADQALTAFSSVRTAFYDNRVDELDDAGLLPYAAALAQHFVGEDRRASRVEVADTLAACRERHGDAPDARQVRRELVARGVVWARDGGYEPGIPSMLAHVAECAA